MSDNDHKAGKEPAFPFKGKYSEHIGISKRLYIATHLMGGLLASNNMLKLKDQYGHHQIHQPIGEFADMAFIAADILIEENENHIS